MHILTRFAHLMEGWINPERETIICGDFNFDRKEKNALSQILTAKNFKQIVEMPTTYRGNCIDHVYHNLSEDMETAECLLRHTYFSDHDAVCVMITDD